MNEATTVNHTTQEAATPSQAVDGSGMENAAASPSIHADPSKRLKTYGEKKFDLITYGGYAMLGNELASLGILHTAEHGFAKNAYAKFKHAFTRHAGKPFVPDYVGLGHFPHMVIAVIGGMLMVPFIKHREEHKGDIVRADDRNHYGAAVAEQDPAIVAAHQEMDETPKQSWGSLWKGRVVTVLAAFGLDSLVGWKDAPSTKLFKNNEVYQKYASLDRIATQISQKTMDAFHVVEKNRPTVDKILQKGSWLLAVSTALTALFYVSSKLFAEKREERVEQKKELHTPTELHKDVAGAAEETIAPSNQPSSRVADVQHENRLAAPQLAQGVS